MVTAPILLNPCSTACIRTQLGLLLKEFLRSFNVLFLYLLPLLLLFRASELRVPFRLTGEARLLSTYTCDEAFDLRVTPARMFATWCRTTTESWISVDDLLGK